MFKRRKAEQKICFVHADSTSGASEVAFGGSPSVLEVALEGDVAISHSCGGNGTCGTCRIEILAPTEFDEPRNELELEIAEARSFGAKERLACQIGARDGMRVRVPHGMVDDDQST